MKDSSMSVEEKLELVLSALQTIVVGTTDVLTARYCVIILGEVEDELRLKKLRKFYNQDLN